MAFSSSYEGRAESDFDIPAARPSDGTENSISRLDESGLVNHPGSISCSQHGVTQKADEGSDPCISERNTADKFCEPGAYVNSHDIAPRQTSYPAEELTCSEKLESDCTVSEGLLPCVEACSSSKLEIRVERPLEVFGQSSSLTAIVVSEAPDGMPQGTEMQKQQDSGGREREENTSQLPGKLNSVADLECRVCHSSLGIQSDCGEAMKLGCACKEDLAVAHRRCAEAWFRIKGNRICEVCGVDAANVLGIKDVEFMKRFREGNSNSPNQRNARWWNRMPICNLLISLIIAAIVLPWLFHVDLFG